MADVPVLKARKQPRQVRSQITVTALIDATRRVLINRGYAECTTNLVAEVAGVGIGSLYEYFPNKESLVAAVAEREVEEFTVALERAMFPSIDTPFTDTMRNWLATALDELEARRDLLLLLIREYPYMGHLPTLARLPVRMAELAASCLRRCSSEVHVPDDPATYYLLANMLGGAYLAHALQPVAYISREAMLDALVEIMMRVLQPSRVAGTTLRASVVVSAC